MVKDYVQKHNKFSPTNNFNSQNVQFATIPTLIDPVDLVDSKVIADSSSPPSTTKKITGSTILTRNQGIAKPSDKKVLTTMQEQGSLEETQQQNLLPKNDDDHQTNDDKISEASEKADALSKAEEEESKKSMTPRDQAKLNHISPVKDSPSKDDSPMKEELKVSDHD